MLNICSVYMSNMLCDLIWLLLRICCVILCMWFVLWIDNGDRLSEVTSYILTVWTCLSYSSWTSAVLVTVDSLWLNTGSGSSVGTRCLCMNCFHEYDCWTVIVFMTGNGYCLLNNSASYWDPMSHNFYCSWPFPEERLKERSRSARILSCYINLELKGGEWDEL